MPLEELVAEKVRSAERSVARVRVLVGVVVAICYVFFVDPAQVWVGPARALMLASSVYVLGVLVLEPYRRLPVMVASVATTLLDALLIALWVLFTGGASSLLVLLYFVAIPTVAYRFGERETVLATIGYVASYGVVVGVSGQLATHASTVGIRVAFLLLAAAVAALTTREAAAQTRGRIEARQRMQEALSAEKRFRGLLEAAPDAMVIYDAEGRILIVNSEAERIFGAQRGDLLGASVSRLVPQGLPRVLPGVGQAVATSEVQVLRADGTAFSAEARVSPVQMDEAWGFTATLRDLTERKRAEEERLTSMERLKELERLRELDRFKTTFINTAAHELGTPLTPIKLQLHLLKADGGRFSESQRKSVDILDRNVNRLAELVRDLLDVARLQASRLGIERHRVDLNRVVLETVETFQEQARVQGLILEARLSPDLHLEADAHRLTQVLFNLLSNALKFTPSGGRVVVETSRGEGVALVRVRDSGIGIRPEDIRRLFQPFSQVHDPMKNTRTGSGLGLYISRGIVELHGGRIACESKGSGQGTTFTVSLPLDGAASAVARERAPRTGDEALAQRARELV